jgi:hypothetical protein
MAKRDKLILGSAGALAPYEREARNSFSVKRFEIEIERPAGEGARAPCTKRLISDRIDFVGNAEPLSLFVFPVRAI